MSKLTSRDVAIIGGGVIGLSLARELARCGLSVAVVERDRCGGASSWAAAGVLGPCSWHRKDPAAALLRMGIERYRSLSAELLEQTGIDPQYVRCGRVAVLRTDQQVRMAASEARAAGAFTESYGQTVFELLDPHQLRRLEPNLTGELLGGAWCPVAGQVRNPRLLRALAAACRQQGVALLENTAARGLIRRNDRVLGVQTCRGDLTAGVTVLAAGAWSGRLCPELARRVRVYPVRGQVVLLEQHPSPVRTIVKYRKCYIVPRRDGKLLVGATEEHEAGYDARPTAEGMHSLLEQARDLVPALARARVLAVWAGLRPGTPDRKPLLGPVPGFEGLIAATGHFRTGLILAPVTAQIVRDLILHGRTELDISRWRCDRVID